jgi:microcystin-dependent protein
MSRNGSGTYNLPAGNPVVTATTITSAWANTTLSDIATALTGSLAADGQTPATGNLNMNTNQIKNVVDPTLAQDATTKAYVDTTVSTAVAAVNSVITGSIQMWPTASAPTGYLLCAGAAVSRTTYAALFAIIGTTFGVGDGSTTFNLPNYTNRMPYGTTVGATGGSADAIVVSHTHTASVSDPGHTHTSTWSTPNDFNRGSLPAGVIWVPDDQDYGLQNTTSNSATTGISVSNSTTGSSGTNANLPPYLGINFIIKV